MKAGISTVCLTLFALVNVAWSLPLSGNQDFIPANIVDKKSMSIYHPMEPANYISAPAPYVSRPVCVREGYFRDPYNCGKFYACEAAKAVPIAFYCQRGFSFNTENNWCDYPEFVEC